MMYRLAINVNTLSHDVGRGPAALRFLERDNTETAHEAVNDELSQLSAGGVWTAGRLGGSPPPKRARSGGHARGV